MIIRGIYFDHKAETPGLELILSKDFLWMILLENLIRFSGKL